MKISLFLALTAFIPSLALADGTGDAHKVKTRFGVADSTTHELTLNGKPVHPRAIGNGFLLVDKVAQTGDADYLLLTSDGGMHALLHSQSLRSQLRRQRRRLFLVTVKIATK